MTGKLFVVPQDPVSLFSNERRQALGAVSFTIEKGTAAPPD